jgi:hypothetical protein
VHERPADRGGDGGPGAVPVFVAVLCGIAAISYSSWILGVFLNPGSGVRDGYVSELSANDQPYHTIFAAGDFMTGALTIVVASTALARLRRRPAAVIGWLALLLFGVGAIGDAVFTLDCAPSLDTGCALRERAAHVSLSHQLHALTSSIVIFAGVAAVLALSMAARRYGWWPALARWGRVLAVAEAGCAVATLVLMLRGESLGLAQRLQISILCLALFVIAWALLVERGTGTTAPASAERTRAVVAAGAQAGERV